MIRQFSSVVMAVAFFSSGTSDSLNFRPYISTNLAKATMIKQIEVIEDECDGSGWIIQGDGHKTECPGCSKCEAIESEPVTPTTTQNCVPARKQGLLRKIFWRR